MIRFASVRVTQPDDNHTTANATITRPPKPLTSLNFNLEGVVSVTRRGSPVLFKCRSGCIFKHPTYTSPIPSRRPR
jgi:hypothetical protein